MPEDKCLAQSESRRHNTIVVYGTDINSSDDFVNYGTLMTNANLQGSGELTNDGTLTNYNGGTLTNEDTLTNTGTLSMTPLPCWKTKPPAG